MTMRYSHLAPGHLESAKKLNPLTLYGHNMDTDEITARKEEG